MPEVAAAVVAHDLQSESVRRPAQCGRVDPGRVAHLLEGRRLEHVAGVAEQEPRKSPEVCQRRPELPGGSHRPGIVLGLSGVTAVSAGQTFTAALKSDGTLDSITKEWLSDKASAPVLQP